MFLKCSGIVIINVINSIINVLHLIIKQIVSSWGNELGANSEELIAKS